jgi:hypothetical protein
MKDILFNLALIDTTMFCKEHNLDCSGSFLTKYPRKFTYALCKQDTGRAIVTVTFHKRQVPTHIIHKD